jgi:hypothetical protein
MEYVQTEISHEASIHISMEKKLQLITEFPREPKLHFVEDITGNFANEREIGKGSFGVVYKVYLNFHHHQFEKKSGRSYLNIFLY